jgi:RNA 3'-terminal phosphate cyclase
MAQEYLDDEMKVLVAQLGAAVHNSVAVDERIMKVIDQLRECGYEITILLQMRIGLEPLGSGEAQCSPTAPKEATPKVVGDEVASETFTAEEIKHFLNHLGIGLRWIDI